MPAEAFTRIELKFSARRLKNLNDPIRKNSPVAQVYHEMLGAKRVLIGQTEIIDRNLNPDWLTGVLIDYIFEVEQTVIVKVLDVRRDKETLKDAELIGKSTFQLAKLASAEGQYIGEKLMAPHSHKLQGALMISGEFQNAQTSDISHLKFKASRLPLNVSRMLCLVVNKLPSSQFIMWKKMRDGEKKREEEVEKRDGESEYVKLCESNVVKGSSEPEWKSVSIPLRDLCNGINLHRDLKIDIVDNGSLIHNEPTVISSLEITWKDLKESSGAQLTLKGPEGQDHGQLLLSTIQIQRVPTFTDYLRGGVNIKLTLGIDFSHTNGTQTDPSSLHYSLGRDKPNDYERAIKQVGSILGYYDSDQMYPVYGFAAKPNKNSSVSYCFPLGPDGAEVHGTEGILKAYKSTLKKAQFSEPTLFAPLINTLIDDVRNAMASNKYDPYTYYVLLMLTNGDAQDIKTTIDKIVEASFLPISIIIVGIGQSDFAEMNVLDADKARLKSRKGKVQQQDNVQFVTYRNVENCQLRLARELLKEVPETLSEHFHTHRKMKPRPPLGRSMTAEVHTKALTEACVRDQSYSEGVISAKGA